MRIYSAQTDALVVFFCSPFQGIFFFSFLLFFLHHIHHFQPLIDIWTTYCTCNIMSISTQRESDNTITSVPSGSGSGSGSGSSSTQHSTPSTGTIPPHPPQMQSQPSSAASSRAFFSIGGRIGARSGNTPGTPGLIHRSKGPSESSEKDATLPAHSTSVNIPSTEHSSSTTNEKNPTQEALEDIDDHPKHSSSHSEKESNSDDHGHGHGHHLSLTERLHFQRPDRHLFPYRSAKENWRAARTFLRRFFLLLLIVPAWVVPNVLTAKAERDLASHGGVEGASAGGGHEGGGGHGVELKKGENLAVFFLNMLVMMHLGKVAGAALEELVPRFGMVSLFLSLLSLCVVPAEGWCCRVGRDKKWGGGSMNTGTGHKKAFFYRGKR